MIGGGTGPATGTNATTCTPGPWHLARMLQAVDRACDERRPHRQGQCGDAQSSVEQIKAGACALKLARGLGHRRPRRSTAACRGGTRMTWQVMIHTDTLNEKRLRRGYDRAFKGRTIHAFHTEGAGGGHAPDIIKVCGLPNVLPSSTNPTRPYTINTIDEHLDMLMVCHHLDPDIPRTSPSPRAASARRRSRPRTSSTISAPSHHLVGQPGDGPRRRGAHPHLADRRQDEAPARAPARRERRQRQSAVRRYIAKYTINPAIAQGIGTSRIGRGRQARRPGLWISPSSA
jgi:urease subunit alpha